MGDLNKYFSRKEFECKCGCGFNTVDAELLSLLTGARKRFNAAVIINSACRCEQHNKNEGGAATSQHLFGRAADATIVGVSPDEVYSYFHEEVNHQGGLGRYISFTHIDSRSFKARW